MADTTDILGLRITSRDGSDAADLGNIIADLGEDVDAKVGSPSLTTTQINALTGSAKAAGRRVWDSTLGVEKVSNGTTWEPQASRAYADAAIDAAMDELAATVVEADAAIDAAMDELAATVVELTEGGPYLPSAGGTLTGDLIFDTTNPDGHKIMFRTSGIDGWRILADTGGAFAVQRRDPSTGAYVDNPLLIDTNGAVSLPNSFIAAGGTLTGDLIFDTTNPDGHKIMFRTSGIDGWRILADTGGAFAVQRRDPSTGAYLDNPLLITAAGHVESPSHIGNVASGSTNAAGYLTVPVLASPTGNWSVACNGARADTGAPLTVVGIPTSSTQVTFTCYWGTSAYQGAVQILYHLIAY